MSRFAPDAPPLTSTLTSMISNFYREEFLKHQQCLQEQREYYSDTAIMEVEAALKRILGGLEHLCECENADQVVSQLLRKFDIVTNLSAWSDPKNVH
jgi:hypothetical protein